MSKTTYYINGNAVREIGQPQPQRRPQKSRRELEEASRRKNRRNIATGKAKSKRIYKDTQ